MPLCLLRNPEAHLHPKGQAVLMELVSKAVASVSTDCDGIA